MIASKANGLESRITSPQIDSVPRRLPLRLRFGNELQRPWCESQTNNPNSRYTEDSWCVDPDFHLASLAVCGYTGMS